MKNYENQILGIIGLLFALFGLFMIPYGFLLSIIGIIFSSIQLTKKKKDFAVIGMAICLITLAISPLMGEKSIENLEIDYEEDKSDIGVFYMRVQENIHETLGKNKTMKIKISLPEIAEKICFLDSSKIISTDHFLEYNEIQKFGAFNANTFIMPMNSINFPFTSLENLSIAEMTKSSNPYCIDAKKNITMIPYNGSIMIRDG